MPQEEWRDIQFHPASPHVKFDDAFPVVLTHRLAGHETLCLRWYGVADDSTIRGVLFYFPLDLGPRGLEALQGEPMDYAVLFVGAVGQCTNLNVQDEQLMRHGLKREDKVAWLAKMPDGVQSRPHSFLAKVISLGDPICGIIEPHAAWLPDHYAKCFER